MKKVNSKNKIIGYLICLSGIALLINGIIAALLTNGGLGIWLTFGLGLLMTVLGIFYTSSIFVFPKALLICSAIILILLLSAFTFLYTFGSIDSSSYSEDALIVLGCGVKGDEPGANLTERLDAAIEYHKKNPDAIIIVSGGKGDDENLSEAKAMEKYLISHGISADKIIKEDRATSTEENFIFSKEILDEYFNEDYKIAFITNDFHIFRSSRFAALSGLKGASHVHSDTTWYTVVPNGLRECITVLKLLILDQWKY